MNRRNTTRLIALILTAVCLMAGMSVSAVGDTLLPFLNLDVRLFNVTPDGQADAVITVYYSGGLGEYAQDRMDSLSLELTGNEALSCDQHIISLGSPVSFAQAAVHLSVIQGGQTEPKLTIRAKTDNCGEAEVTCAFHPASSGDENRTRCYVFTSPEGTPFDDVLPQASEEVISCLTILAGYASSAENPVVAPLSDFDSVIRQIADMPVSADDLTIFCLCFAGIQDAENHPTDRILVSAEPQGRRLGEMLEMIERQVPGKVAVLIDGCYNRTLAAIAGDWMPDPERFFMASVSTALFSPESGEAAGYGKTVIPAMARFLAEAVKTEGAALNGEKLKKTAEAIVKRNHTDFKLVRQAGDKIEQDPAQVLSEETFSSLNEELGENAGVYLKCPWIYSQPTFYGNAELPFVAEPSAGADWSAGPMEMTMSEIARTEPNARALRQRTRAKLDIPATSQPVTAEPEPVPTPENTPTPEPVLTPEPAEEVTPEPRTDLQQYDAPEPESSFESFMAVTQVKNVNVRAEMSQKSKRVTLIKQSGTRVTVMDEDSDSEGRIWYRVTLQDGTAGWILSKFLAAVSDPAEAVYEVTQVPNLQFTRGRFPRGQKYAVYTAPGSSAWRGANGRAAVSTNGDVWVAGSVGDWLLVYYETNQGSIRVGYIDVSQSPALLNQTAPLMFAQRPATLLDIADLTDDPLRSGSILTKLKSGKQVTLLAYYNAYAYVETSLEDRTTRGFVPAALIQEN